MLFKRVGTILTVLILTLAHTTSSGQNFNYHQDYKRILKRTKASGDTLSYSYLLPKFLRNDPSLTVFQMLCVMIGYTGQPGFSPYKDLATEQAIYKLNNTEKYKEAIAVCDTFLSIHPLNQQAIIEKAYAFHKLNIKDSAAFYKKQFANIMAAMDWSADGKTPDHAMFAIGPDDGKNFIDKYYHADIGRSEEIKDSNGATCSMMEMKFKKDGKEQSLVFYFMIQHAIGTKSKPKKK